MQTNDNLQFYFMAEVKLESESPLRAVQHPRSAELATHDNQFEGLKQFGVSNESGRQKSGKKKASSNPTDYADSQTSHYFKSKIYKITEHQKLVDDLIKASQQSVHQHFQQGSLVISERTHAVQQLLSPTIKTSREVEKISKIVNRKKELQLQLKKLSDELQVSEDELEPTKSKNSAQNELSSQEHKLFMERMAKIRKISDQKRRLAAQYAQKKNAQYLKKQQQQIIERQVRQREQKQNKIKQNMLQIQKRREKQKLLEKESTQRFKSISQQKRIYQRMEENYQSSFVLPLLEERKKTLDERKKKLQGFSIEEIRAFEREHMKMLEQRSTSQIHQEQDWHYKPPPCSPRLLQLLQQQKIQYKIKLQQKKRGLQQKKCRQESFLQYLKERIPIKIDPEKKKQMEKLMQKQPKRQRSESQKITMGNSYMMEAKTRIKHPSKDKKQSQSMRDEKKDQTQSVISNISTPSKKKASLAELQRKKLDQLISSENIEDNQKIDNLKAEVQKMGERKKRKQQMSRFKKGEQPDEDDLDELLGSVKAKLGIMEIYSK